jgi:ABC-type Fe3+-hydroxamate transport system substrate-binding protein
VAVSNYCHDNPAAKNLPTAGDYQTTDWERLASLKPDLLLVFIARDRLPPGMVDRATELGIRVENVQTETIADVLSTLTRLGDLLGDPVPAQAGRNRIASRLDALRAQAASEPGVRTLLVVGESGLSLVGRGGFLDELLAIAGGINVGAELGPRYPSLDEEKLASLKYDAVIVLLPSASPATADAARQGWTRRLGPSSPVKVTILTDWYLLLPGAHIGDVAESFHKALHPAR